MSSECEAQQVGDASLELTDPTQDCTSMDGRPEQNHHQKPKGVQFSHNRRSPGKIKTAVVEVGL